MTVVRDFRVVLSAGFVKGALGQLSICLAFILLPFGSSVSALLRLFLITTVQTYLHLRCPWPLACRDSRLGFQLPAFHPALRIDDQSLP